MAWSPPRTWIDTETVTAALLNSSIRDMFLELWKFVSKGDLLFAQSGTVISRLAIGSNGQALVADSTQTLGVKWSGGPIVPVGGIILWSGSVAAIPSGWALCNGSSGTPNLVNRFILGASSTSPTPGTTGGASTATLSHEHSINTVTGGAINVVSTGYFYNTGTDGHTHNVTGNTEQTPVTVGTEPPYYALCYIMRIS